MAIIPQAETHKQYFGDQWANSIPEFWKRFGTVPEFDGQRVLEVGCGHGGLCLYALYHGASEVVGVDLDEERIAWAREYVADAETRPITFLTEDVRSLDGEFDIILSKDTFEHIEDLPSVLSALGALLAPGGELWTGFSPLYYSPFGDHRRTGMKMPWAHAVLPGFVVNRCASRKWGRPVRSLADIGLNGMTPQQFREWTAQAGLEIKSIRYNRSTSGDRLAWRVLSQLREHPRLERYSTISIYAVLARADRQRL